MKECRACFEVKPLEAFSRNNQTKDGLAPYCRACRAEKARADRMRRGDEINARRREIHAANPKARQARDKAWRERNAEKVKQQRRDHYARYRETIKAKNAAYREANPEVKRRGHLRTYGLTIEQWDAMYAAQKGRCAICGGPGGAKGLVVDHCHDSLVVRGLLCGNCNLGLGAFADDPRRMRAAIRYLMR